MLDNGLVLNYRPFGCRAVYEDTNPSVVLCKRLKFALIYVKYAISSLTLAKIKNVRLPNLSDVSITFLNLSESGNTTAETNAFHLAKLCLRYRIRIDWSEGVTRQWRFECSQFCKALSRLTWVFPKFSHVRMWVINSDAFLFRTPLVSWNQKNIHLLLTHN